MVKAIGLAVVLLAMAAPAAAQEAERAQDVLREARELAGMDPDVGLVNLVVRTEIQAARYCEVSARYWQALQSEYETKYQTLLESLIAAPQDLKWATNAALGYANFLHWWAGLLTISVAANTDAERDRLNEICAQAHRAAQPQGR
jgi:hypothetical protein